MKFLCKMFSFATDDDGLSLKDIVTLVVLVIWSVVIVTGLTSDYTGIKLEQFSMILESSTDLTVYVIIATLGLVATDNIASMLSKGRTGIKGQSTEVKKSEDVYVPENEKEPEPEAEKKEEPTIRSEDII